MEDLTALFQDSGDRDLYQHERNDPVIFGYRERIVSRVGGQWLTSPTLQHRYFPHLNTLQKRPQLATVQKGLLDISHCLRNQSCYPGVSISLNHLKTIRYLKPANRMAAYKKGHSNKFYHRKITFSSEFRFLASFQNGSGTVVSDQSSLQSQITSFKCPGHSLGTHPNLETTLKMPLTSIRYPISSWCMI